jgi:hypothetical protein
MRQKVPLSTAARVGSSVEDGAAESYGWSCLERFSNWCALIQFVQGGFFLLKKLLDRSGFGVEQLENRCTDPA